MAAAVASAIEDGELREIFEVHTDRSPKSLKLIETRPRTFDAIGGYEAPYRPNELSYLASQNRVY